MAVPAEVARVPHRVSERVTPHRAADPDAGVRHRDAALRRVEEDVHGARGGADPVDVAEVGAHHQVLPTRPRPP